MIKLFFFNQQDYLGALGMCSFYINLTRLNLAKAQHLADDYKFVPLDGSK